MYPQERTQAAFAEQMEGRERVGIAPATRLCGCLRLLLCGSCGDGGGRGGAGVVREEQ